MQQKYKHEKKTGQYNCLPIRRFAEAQDLAASFVHGHTTHNFVLCEHDYKEKNGKSSHFH